MHFVNLSMFKWSHFQTVSNIVIDIFYQFLPRIFAILPFNQNCVRNHPSFGFLELAGLENLENLSSRNSINQYTSTMALQRRDFCGKSPIVRNQIAPFLIWYFVRSTFEINLSIISLSKWIVSHSKPWKKLLKEAVYFIHCKQSNQMHLFPN